MAPPLSPSMVCTSTLASFSIAFHLHSHRLTRISTLRHFLLLPCRRPDHATRRPFHASPISGFGRYVCDRSPSLPTPPLREHREPFLFSLPPSAPASASASALAEEEGFSSDADDSEEWLSDGVPEDQSNYLVINFYHFVGIDCPQEEVDSHKSFVQNMDIHGRIYINHQGINAQLSGPPKDVLAYTDWVKQDRRFADMFLQVSPSPIGHAFPRLKLRYKPSLVQVGGGTQNLPLTNSLSRATPLEPTEWKARLEEAEMSDSVDATNRRKRRILLLDVRNGYEWDVGHFRGAERPDVDCFKSTEFGVSEREKSGQDPLEGIDRESTDVLMYCTGGIRCDVYSTILRREGFENLYTLKGGVARYLMEVGPANWLGNLFVFDSRLAMSPVHYKPDIHSKDIASCNSLCNEEEDDEKTLSDFARCYQCGEALSLIRHRNCSNVDCNRLYLSCEDCMKQSKGCCSPQCLSAPRLRPLLSEPKPYKRWHNYRSSG